MTGAEETIDEAEMVWRAKAQAALGADVETLVARSADGIDIRPLYARRRGHGPRPWRARPAWAVAQRVDHPDAEMANALALAELEGGGDALTLVGSGSPFARGFGLAPDVDLSSLLDGIELDFVSLRIDAGGDTPAIAHALGAVIAQRTLTSAALDVDLCFDPIGIAAVRGGAPALDALPGLLEVAERSGLVGRPLLADGRPYHEAGAGEALELAAILSTGVAYLRAMEDAGLALEAARGKVAALLAVDADVYLGLAKARAMRRLWARIETASGLEPIALRLHAETSWRMMTRRDPWTNVMRATAATVAAGLGGVDAVTVLPMTLPSGLPDAPARRLARNVQRVLLDEANLAKVDDPGAGSGAIEALTDAICERAWALFQEIERDGGIATSLADGALPKRLIEAAQARAHAVATLAHGIVGTSRFPKLDAPAPGVLDVPRRAEPEHGSGALSRSRDAVPFEEMRDRAETMADRPSIFLAALGTPAAFGPRATWAANVFAAAGVEAVPPVEEHSPSDLARDFAASGATVACLVGTDAAYRAEATALAAALREAGARRVLLAGRESDGISGLDAFVHDGCDALSILSDTLDALEA